MKSENQKNLSEAREITSANLLDLARNACRYHWRLVRRCGLEMDDAVSLICLKALERQQLHTPYDPERATALAWMRVLAGSVLLNQLDKQKRKAKHPPPRTPTTTWTDTSVLFNDDEPEVPDLLTYFGHRQRARVAITEELAWGAVRH